MSRYRVLFVTPWYPTRETPSSGVFVREHARAAALGNEVAVLHLAGRAKKTRGSLLEESDEDLTWGLKTWRLRHAALPLPRTDVFAQTIALWQSVAKVERALGWKIDLIHAHIFLAGAPAAAVSKLKRLPLLISEHYSALPLRLLSRQDILKARFAFRQAELVLPVNDILRRAIQDHGVSAKFRIVPNAVDVSLFSPSTRDKREGITFLYVGNLYEEKGLGDLLRALAHVNKVSRDWQLWIVGGGQSSTSWEELASDLGIGDKTQFLGTLAKADVAQAMRKASALVMPSWFEVQSVAVLEAMACGLPVLSTAVGGLVEMVGGGRGATYPAHDIAALRALLEDFLAGRLELGGKERAEVVALQHSLESVGTQLSEIYNEVSEERRRPRQDPISRGDGS